MKTNTSFKTILFPTLLLMATLFFSACSNSPKEAEDKRDLAEKQRDASTDSSNRVSDAQFMVTAAEINLAEIKLGQLAQHRGSIKEVKTLGKMMETAHTQGLSDVMAIAMQKGITVPLAATNDVEDAFQNLNRKSGNEFDREYCNRMVTGHKAAIVAFEKAAVGAADDDIKSWAATTLPALHTHLEHAMACEKKVVKGIASLE